MAKVHNLFSGDISPRLLTVLDKFDDSLRQTIETAFEDNIPQGLIVAVLQAYTQQQTFMMFNFDEDD